MMTKYIIDFDKLKENDITLDEFILLLKIYDDLIPYNNYKCITGLQSKLFIKILTDEDNKSKFVIREKGKLLVESLIYKGQSSINIQKISYTKPTVQDKFSNFDEFVKQYRLLFKGLKVGSQGDKNACKDKLKRWMIDNPSYSKEDVLKAANTYIKSVDNYQYLQQADYFIYKKDKYGEHSRLSTFVDEPEVIDEGWSSELK